MVLPDTSMKFLSASLCIPKYVICNHARDVFANNIFLLRKTSFPYRNKIVKKFFVRDYMKMESNNKRNNEL